MVWATITGMITALVDYPVTLILVVAVLRIGWGIVLGLLFAVVVDRFMPTTPYRSKGVIFGLGLSVVEIGGNLLPTVFGVDFSWLNLAIDIVSVLVYGYILGNSYGRLVSRKFS